MGSQESKVASSERGNETIDVAREVIDTATGMDRFVTLNKGQASDLQTSSCNDWKNDPIVTKLNGLHIYKTNLSVQSSFLDLNDPLPLPVVESKYLENILTKYESVLRKYALDVSNEQKLLKQKVEDTNELTRSLLQQFGVRQRKFAKQADCIFATNDMVRSLSKCQTFLNQSKELVKTLNEMLPENEQLEPLAL